MYDFGATETAIYTVWQHSNEMPETVRRTYISATTGAEAMAAVDRRDGPMWHAHAAKRGAPAQPVLSRQHLGAKRRKDAYR